MVLKDNGTLEDQTLTLAMHLKIHDLISEH